MKVTKNMSNILDNNPTVKWVSNVWPLKLNHWQNIKGQKKINLKCGTQY